MYLWCDLRDFQCKSKIRRNGNCTGLEGTNVCWQSNCIRGTCQGTETPVDITAAPIVESTKSQGKTPDVKIVRIITQGPQEIVAPFVPTDTPIHGQSMVTGNRPDQKVSSYITALPLGSYNTKVTQSPQTETDSTVFFKTFMVDENGAMTTGTVQVEGVNYQGTSTSSPITTAKYPEHPGIVYVQIKDPSLAFVQAKVTAYDGQGKPCRPYCAQGYYKDAYVPCAGQITLSPQSDHSNPIPFTANNNFKRFLNADMSLKPASWKVRAPYLSFLCGSETNFNKFQELADSVKAPVNTSDHLWFHVLVLDGRVPYHRGLPGSTIQSKSVDYIGGTYQAKVPGDSAFPHYFGVAPVKAQNPSRSSSVKVDVEAFDPSGRACTPTCQDASRSYIKCQGTVTLNNDPKLNDFFSFTSDDDLKDFLNWDLTDHPNSWRRMVSNMQFVC